MENIYTAAHTESAIDLYELRQSWLAETEIHASAYESVEERLCASLYQVSRSLPETQADTQTAETLPKKEGECFVFLASHLNSPKPNKSKAGYALAYEWLSLDPAKAVAAEAALSLYPEIVTSTDASTLLKLYEEQEALHPILMRLFRKQMQTLPLALLHAAASDETSSAELKIEALHYAAAHPDLGLDLFRSHYVPLLSGRSQFDASLIAVALWGGLVRGDAEAHTALAAALSHTRAPQDLAPLLRLAALSGSPDFLPILLQAADTDPDSGYPLLVLYGQKSVIPALLNALEAAHTIEQAAAAFEQLTDHTLPRIPRLTIVGEEADDNDEEASEQIPDVKAAHTWWQHNQARWKTDERWLAGQATTPAHLTALTKKHAGQFGCDLMALLALSQQAPLNIPREIWRARQQQLLAAHTAASKPAAKVLAQPKATSARHA
jgi:hypothetical protein